MKESFVCNSFHYDQRLSIVYLMHVIVLYDQDGFFLHHCKAQYRSMDFRFYYFEAAGSKQLDCTLCSSIVIMVEFDSFVVGKWDMKLV